VRLPREPFPATRGGIMPGRTYNEKRKTYNLPLLLPLLAALLTACSPANGGEPAAERVATAGEAGAAAETSPAPPASGMDLAGEVDYRVVTVVEGLEHPWGLAFLPGDEGMLVTERPGRLRVVRNGQLAPQPIQGVPQVQARGQGGLLDVALHPDFGRNRLVYLTYSKPGQQGATTALARGRLEGDRLAGVQDIFVGDAWGTGGQHFGSRIVFDRQAHVYLTIGDRGQPRRAGDPGDHVGATIRLHDDGRVPSDNPFVGRAEGRDEVYSYGHRNAQGMALHPGTGEVWLHEHGPRGGDEVNVVRPGSNYGWPQYNFGNHYDGRRIPDPTPRAGTELPVLHWTPSIAPSGMTFYTGDAFPQWRGDLFVGALAGQHLRRVRLDGTQVVEQESLLEGEGHRIRDVRTGPDGLIYLLVDARRGAVLRVEPGG
jgi:aldose sugar dehydrogenase